MMSASVDQLGLQDEELRACYQKYPVPVNSQVIGILAESLQWIWAFPARVRDGYCLLQADINATAPLKLHVVPWSASRMERKAEKALLASAVYLTVKWASSPIWTTWCFWKACKSVLWNISLNWLRNHSAVEVTTLYDEKDLSYLENAQKGPFW